MSFEPTVIETARLRISLACAADAAALRGYHLRNAAHLGPWEPLREAGYHGATEWEARAAAALEQAVDGTQYQFVARFQGADGQGEIIARANFSNVIRGAFDACTLGYSVDARHEGQGVMTEMLEALIPHVFGELGLHRIMAAHLPENTRSAALLARLGFEVEGHARDYLRIAGRWRDHVLTAKISD
ncbi:alanine acetyltransferase [Salipiger sp. CCB-MM3]|uniref:GNAT family N-acetyltransferase n=1 Tax=Salipiger sp. CCB-MM3 TaxID=1792508 RepID=UPI00080A9EBD|nr:GNAT family N-acetyltransferase [Salipiger sp. CCB-MM3]ANT59341.1 alanine acetyltransferase [Salipiger sp. CCB-MM3]